MVSGLAKNEDMLKIEVYLKMVKAASNMWAMYNILVLFEYLRESQQTGRMMNNIRPISKFACIKLIVLFSLWQEMVFGFLAKRGCLPIFQGFEQKWFNQDDTGKAAVSFLVCLEMLVFAQWHRYGYPVDEAWSGSENILPEDSTYSPAPLQCSILIMAHDISYLLRTRVNGQSKVIAQLRRFAQGEEIDMSDSSELKQNFRNFELDAHGEASIAQLQFALFKSGLERNWDTARENLIRSAGGDSSGRLTYDKFIEVVRQARSDPEQSS